MLLAALLVVQRWQLQRRVFPFTKFCLHFHVLVFFAQIIFFFVISRCLLTATFPP